MSKEIAEKILERGSDVGRLSESIQLAENYLALEAENKRLRELLRVYGHHDRLCPQRTGFRRCNCGFSKALQTSDKEG